MEKTIHKHNCSFVLKSDGLAAEVAHIKFDSEIHKNADNKLIFPDWYDDEHNIPVLSIGDEAAYGDKHRVTQVFWPQRLRRIGYSSFRCCSNYVFPPNFPDELRAIGDYAFYNSGIKGPITFYKRVPNECSSYPSMLASVGNRAFAGCNNINGTLVTSQKKIEDYTYCGSGIEQLILGENTENISAGAFANCKQLNGKINCPRSLKKICEYAFWGDLNVQFCLNYGIRYLGSNSLILNNNKPILVLPSSIIRFGYRFVSPSFKKGNFIILVPHQLEKQFKEMEAMYTDKDVADLRLITY